MLDHAKPHDGRGAYRTRVQERADEQLRRMYAEVAANMDRLDSCTGHEFLPVPERARCLGVECTCTRCGGKVDAIRAWYYNLGRQHAAPPAPRPAA